MQGEVGANGAATPRAPDPEQGNYPMRETERDHTTSRPRLPLGNDFASTIARLKAIADKSTDAALTEGEVSPDHILLDYCADALHLLKRGEDVRNQRHALDRQNWTDELRAADRALFDEWQDFERQAKRLMFKAKKLPAQTPAGIYAKAMLVRLSVTGAAQMAMSLAEDMVNCKALRAVLWAPEAMAAGD